MATNIDTVCLVCWETKLKCQLSSITPSIEEIIKDNLNPGLDISKSNVPNTVCGSCRTQLYNMKSGRNVREEWLQRVTHVSI